MSKPVVSLPLPHLWYWPVDVTRYDRSPDLDEIEQAELKRLTSESPFQLRPSTKEHLHRLLSPLQDVFTVTHLSPDICHETVHVLVVEMSRRGKTFWGWSEAEWMDIIGPSYTAFAQRYGRSYEGGGQHPARREVPVLAYLLCAPANIDPLLRPFAIAPIARKVFGRATIEAHVKLLTSALGKWGYREKNHHDFIACLCYLLLRNRSPQLEALHIEFLETVNQTCTFPCVRGYLFQISRALFALSIISRPLPDPKRAARPVTSERDGKMADEWLSWCQRWRAHSPNAGAAHSYYLLLKVGRWLNISYPEVRSPADFTYEVAIEFVAAVMDMKVGEWISTDRGSRLPQGRLGQPLRPNAKSRLLKCLRVFLRDCQEWGWIPIRLNPSRALQAPRSLRNLIGPDPRIVERDHWAKLLWAAMNLEAEDLPTTGSKVLIYPLEMVRAIAVVWCFAALRSDEIVRLRLGCIRWQHEDVMVPATGEVLPKDAVCFLDIPVNKTTTSYTKPVHPLVGKRINEWERLRPHEQPQHVDGKTGEAVQFLFSYRGTRISKGYLNRCLIPHLCRKANIPLEDSRGAITSHRARATIASMLYNAKEPLDILQLRDYLGHKHLASTQSYLKVDPTKLASQVTKAGYLEQNLATIEVLLDQEAVRSGAAARGEPWKYYDLGHGYCLNDFWAECKHRMACARCPFYRPKASLADQLLEGQANLLRMLEFVQLTEEEKLLVTEGIELHQALIEQLADMPTPTGLTPREMETLPVGETAVIPVKSVRRKERKTHGQ
jgi:integrase